MNYSLRTDKDTKQLKATVAVLTLLFGVGSVFLSYILIPFASAFYAMLLMVEREKKKVFTIVCPVIIGLISFAFYGPFAMEGIIYIVLGILIYRLYTRGASKTFTAVVTTSATLLSFILSLVFLAFMVTKNYSFDAVIEFYRNEIAELRILFSETMDSALSNLSADSEQFLIYEINSDEIFNLLLITFIPASVICAFAVSGIALKTFTSLVKHRSDGNSPIFNWNFKVSNLFVYAYIITVLLSMFTADSEGIVAYTILSLYIVFLAVFAYIGIKFTKTLLEKRMGKTPATFLTILIVLTSLLLMIVFVYVVLSFLGVYYTLITNRTSNTSEE